MTGGWLIGVLVETPGEARAVRHFYAVGHPERAKAEWTAVDRALVEGAVASSPVGGLEPVAAIRPIPPQRMKALGLAAGEVRALGWRYPRRWMA